MTKSNRHTAGERSKPTSMPTAEATRAQPGAEGTEQAGTTARKVERGGDGASQREMVEKGQPDDGTVKKHPPARKRVCFFTEGSVATQHEQNAINNLVEAGDRDVSVRNAAAKTSYGDVHGHTVGTLEEFDEVLGAVPDHYMTDDPNADDVKDTNEVQQPED